MELPITLNMHVHTSTLDRRGRTHIHERDVMGLGVSNITTRSNWGAPFESRWTHAGVPNRYWWTYANLRQGMLAIREPEVQQELARYPKLVVQFSADHIKPASFCTVCDAGPVVAAALLAVNWRLEDQVHVQLCAKHQGLLDVPAQLLHFINHKNRRGAL